MANIVSSLEGISDESAPELFADSPQSSRRFVWLFVVVRAPPELEWLDSASSNLTLELLLNVIIRFLYIFLLIQRFIFSPSSLVGVELLSAPAERCFCSRGRGGGGGA